MSHWLSNFCGFLSVRCPSCWLVVCVVLRETVCTAVGEGLMWLRRLMPRDIDYMTSSASCWWGLLRVVSVVVYCERWDVQRWRDDVASASYSPCLLSCTVRGLFYYWHTRNDTSTPDRSDLSHTHPGYSVVIRNGPIFLFLMYSCLLPPPPRIRAPLLTSPFL